MSGRYGSRHQQVVVPLSRPHLAKSSSSCASAAARFLALSSPRRLSASLAHSDLHKRWRTRWHKRLSNAASSR
jgi:hypothetical protein